MGALSTVEGVGGGAGPELPPRGLVRRRGSLSNPPPEPRGPWGAQLRGSRSGGARSIPSLATSWDSFCYLVRGPERGVWEVTSWEGGSWACPAWRVLLGAHPDCPADVHRAAGGTHVSLHVHVSTGAVHLYTACAHACQAAPVCTRTHAVDAHPCPRPRLHAYHHTCMHIACLLWSPHLAHAGAS